MSLQFIKGSSGSGKTEWLNRYLIDESMKNPEKNYLLLVPEQFSLETQRAITQMHPLKGTMNIDVLGFVRLAHQVFAEMGCEDYVVLDDMGKSVILQRAALKHKDELNIFGRNLHKKGFINELKSMLSELYQYGITPKQLEKASDSMKEKGLLAGKLKDMITIYKAFAGELTDETITAEELMPVLCRYLPKSKIIQNAVIALDGYTGFTPVQYTVISMFLKYGAKVIVTVTIDPFVEYKKLLPHDLYYLSGKTISRIYEIAYEEKTFIEPDVCIVRNKKEKDVLYYKLADQKNDSMIIVPEKNRFTDSKELEFLEKNILRYSNSQNRLNSGNEDIRVSVSKFPVGEVKSICEQVYDLVMNDGLRYRDIAIITGNPDIYNPLFEQELMQYDIPCFIDRKNGIMSNILVEYIRSLIEIVLKDFSYESVFRILKCGLAKCNDRDRDILENYILACGIRGNSKWKKEWERRHKNCTDKELEEVNRIRKEISKPLLAFYNDFKKKDITVRQMIEVLVLFLKDNEIEKRVLNLAEEFKVRGELSIAREYEQVYGLVMSLLNEINTLLGEEKMSVSDFSICLDSGLEELKVGIIPACTDRLLVGDMERSRLFGVKVLFFAGVNEGQVPKNMTGGGIFTDYDKEKLSLCNIELSPTEKMNSFIDRFYLYLALTKPSHGLRISYSKTDSDGKNMRPAGCIAEIMSLYPKSKIYDEEFIKKEPENINSKNGMWKYMLSGLSNVENSIEDSKWKEIFSYFFANMPEKSRQMIEALSDGYREESLGYELAKKLYGEALNASVSRLEQQAQCAFSHFLKYGLKLKERETFSFEDSDAGTLFHNALESYFNYVKKENLDITNVSETKRKQIVENCVKNAAASSAILSESARNKWLVTKLERITDRTVWALSEQLKKGGYEPESCEVMFNSDNSKAFTIPLTYEVKMLLNGRIDRIDTRKDEDNLYVRIIDYKSGKRKFDLVSVYYGLQIQLVFYMEAAVEKLKNNHPYGNVNPGGVLYYNIDNPIIPKLPSMNDEDIKLAILKELQMNGMITSDSVDADETDGKKNSKISIVSKEQFESLQNYVHNEITSLGKKIINGDINVNPYKFGKENACKWCSYKSICGFDQKRKGFSYRNLVSMKPEDVWEKILEEDEDDKVD